MIWHLSRSKVECKVMFSLDQWMHTWWRHTEHPKSIKSCLLTLNMCPTGVTHHALAPCFWRVQVSNDSCGEADIPFAYSTYDPGEKKNAKSPRGSPEWVWCYQTHLQKQERVLYKPMQSWCNFCPFPSLTFADLFVFNGCSKPQKWLNKLTLHYVLNSNIKEVETSPYKLHIIVVFLTKLEEQNTVEVKNQSWAQNIFVYPTPFVSKYKRNLSSK